jgi:hypothetical protein
MINNYLGQLLQNYLGLEISVVVAIASLIFTILILGKVGK